MACYCGVGSRCARESARSRGGGAERNRDGVESAASGLPGPPQPRLFCSGPGRARRSRRLFSPPPPSAAARGTALSARSDRPALSRSMLLTVCFRCAVKCSSPFGCGVRSTSTTSSCPLPSTAPGPRGTPTSTTAPGNHQALCRMGEFGSLAPGLELVLSLGVL